jgi:hypothetical protein
MGQALKSPLRIPALDHGIAESVDDLVGVTPPFVKNCTFSQELRGELA